MTNAGPAIVIGAGHIGQAIGFRLALLGYQVRIASHADIELADLGSIERWFRSCDHGIEVLVNAAGAYGAIGPVAKVPPQQWRRALDINLVGVYACCHHAIPRMVAGGHIINIGGGGAGSLVDRSGYAAAKSGLWRLTETLAAEEPRLRVNAIAPGPMDSRMQDAVVANPAPWADFARRLRAGGGAVPVANTLRVLDHILAAGATGQIHFARDFQSRVRAVA